MEQWDLYDENRALLPRKAVRGEALPPGARHLAVSVWTGGSDGTLLVTLRAPEKAECPDCWENTGGSALAGESSLAAARRELWEETGIEADDGELVLISADKEATAFMDTYFLFRDISPEKVRLQPGETAAARRVTVQELDAMAADGTLAGPVARRYTALRDRLLACLSACRA